MVYTVGMGMTDPLPADRGKIIISCLSPSMDVSNCFHTDILIGERKKQYLDIILADF